MIRRPPRSTRTDTLFPYTTLFRTGLFGVLLDDMTPQENSAFFNQFRLFQLGASWGGFESLIVPAWPAPSRSCTPLQKGSLLRVHAGLETRSDERRVGKECASTCRSRCSQYH